MITPMVTFSGIQYDPGMVPPWLSWLQYLSITRFFLLGVLVKQVRSADAAEALAGQAGVALQLQQ